MAGGWQYPHVGHPVRLWLLVVPIATLGVLAGHELAYSLTSTPRDELHRYMSHLPQVALLLALLSIVGALFVERGHRLALWPFPAVVMVAFIAQEHIERLAHTSSVPFLLDKPFFLVGLAAQTVVALAAWLLARLLLRIVRRPESDRRRGVRDRIELSLPSGEVSDCATLTGERHSRAPPFGR